MSGHYDYHDDEDDNDAGEDDDDGDGSIVVARQSHNITHIPVVWFFSLLGSRYMWSCFRCRHDSESLQYYAHDGFDGPRYTGVYI